jgi:protein SCO1
MAAFVMNERALPRPLALIALLIAVLLAGCRAGAAGSPPLEGATMGGPFTLTSQDGRRVSDRDFAGKYRLIYFGYTFCPDVCPTDLQKIGAGMRQFEHSDPRRAARVQPIFITVDPARDTPEVMRRYVANFHPRLIGLTGTEREIADVAREFRILRQVPEPSARSRDYLVGHSQITVLYGPQGEPIAIVPTDQGADAVAAELERWVR